jgi:putative phosphoribosyl transferase
MQLFKDRVEAGKRLASALRSFAGKGAIVLAIPRGGVVVGFEVARAWSSFGCHNSRKIGAPQS